MPIRIDETEIPGLPRTVGYLHITEGIQVICDSIVEKLVAAPRAQVVLTAPATGIIGTTAAALASGNGGLHESKLSETVKSSDLSPEKNAPEEAPVSRSAEPSDGQRFVIEKELSAVGNGRARLILVGDDSESAVLFKQLADVFVGAKWSIEQQIIGQVGIVGIPFPRYSYMTGNDVSAASLRRVFAIFGEAGVALPLVPDAYVGSGSAMTVDLVIVVRGGK